MTWVLNRPTKLSRYLQFRRIANPQESESIMAIGLSGYGCDSMDRAGVTRGGMASREGQRHQNIGPVQST
jgi:hypothetical protein